MAILFQFLIVLLTDIILGGGCLVGGFFLLYKGLTGNAIVTVEVNTIKATIINCSPGIFLIIAGVAILYLNKFSIKLGAEKIENKKGIKIILFLIISILIVGALGFCIYGFLVTDSNNIKWLQKN